MRRTPFLALFNSTQRRFHYASALESHVIGPAQSILFEQPAEVASLRPRQASRNRHVASRVLDQLAQVAALEGGDRLLLCATVVVD